MFADVAQRNDKIKRSNGYEEIIEMKEDVLCDNAELLMDEFANSPAVLDENRELQVC